MNTRLLLIALLPLLILGGCTKETIETKSTTVTKPYVAPTYSFWGTWKVIKEDPTDTLKEYFAFDENTASCFQLEERDGGFRSLDYSSVTATDKLIRFDWDGYRPYKIKGDTMIVYDYNSPGEIGERMVREANAPSIDDWMGQAKVVRKVYVPQDHQTNTGLSFGIDGDFLYVNHLANGTYRFYKMNTLNGTMVDSVNVPNGNWHALHFKASSNKLYNTRYSGSYTMQQRTGLMGASSNLSSNTLSNIQYISTNGSSGTVYASNNNQLYSGSEGGSFSNLFTFTGNYPRAVVYYKNDQFLGVYNGTLVLFKISPSFEIIKQYRLTGPDAGYLEAISTNGSDIWAMTYDNNANRYTYVKVTI